MPGGPTTRRGGGGIPGEVCREWPNAGGCAANLTAGVRHPLRHVVTIAAPPTCCAMRPTDTDNGGHESASAYGPARTDVLQSVQQAAGLVERHPDRVRQGRRGQGRQQAAQSGLRRRVLLRHHARHRDRDDDPRHQRTGRPPSSGTDDGYALPRTVLRILRGPGHGYGLARGRRAARRPELQRHRAAVRTGGHAGFPQGGRSLPRCRIRRGVLDACGGGLRADRGESRPT